MRIAICTEHYKMLTLGFAMQSGILIITQIGQVKVLPVMMEYFEKL